MYLFVGLGVHVSTTACIQRSEVSLWLYYVASGDGAQDVTSAWYRALLLESLCQPYVLFVTEMSLYLPFPRLRSPASESPLQGILYSRSGRIPRTTPTAVCALSPHHILHKHQSRVCFQDLLVRPSLGVTALDRLLCLKEGPM